MFDDAPAPSPALQSERTLTVHSREHVRRSRAEAEFRSVQSAAICHEYRMCADTIDLKDAYFHVSILPQHRKFLRFALLWVLLFGLALSPLTFTKCLDAALALLRLRGIRILNCIDDWLILAQSEHMAVQHRDVVLAHLKELGLRLNGKKSVLSPLQRTTYLGVVWDSTMMQAHLSPARIESILTAVTRVKEGRSLTVKQFQRLLGPNGTCVQCDTFWPAVHETPTVVAQDQGVLPEGETRHGFRSSLSLCNASDGCVSHHLTWHINCLEMLAVFQALKHFLPDLIGHPMLVRTDNTAVVYYINHQGGVVHVPGHLNMGADILSRQGLRPGEWMLYPEVVKQIWGVFGQAQVDLFATKENAQCHHWCSLTYPASLGLDAMVQMWPRLRLYAFPLIAVLPGVLERVRHFFFSFARVLEVVGVAPEGAHLIASGLSTEVVETILQSRAPSSRKLYALKWKLFTSWCGDRQQDSVNCPVGTVLC
ncbi:hypothetical protein H4Q32_028444 [Labeo rohita]|uniref:ribonuclease H n=1 Tax=Labeo rohita TaxID=84645 RepID=A0ABQ8L2R6_LABRO|nr:hypothetical protein H4Q32_028444 [Labeo rohita]